MNRGGQKQDQFLVMIRVSDIERWSNVFDDHHSYHRLASTGVQHGNRISPQRHLKHLRLIPKQQSQSATDQDEHFTQQQIKWLEC